MIDPRRFHAIRSVLSSRQPDLTVLMDQVHKTQNLSAILRSCDAAGLLEAHAVPVEGKFRVSAHTAAGADKWVRLRTHPSVDDAVSALKRDGFTVVAAHPSTDARGFREFDFTRRVAIMIGAELHGLSDRGVELADELIEIPMMGMAHSLNVSVATAVILFEVVRQRQEAGMYSESRLTPDDFDKLLFEWCYPRQAAAYRSAGRPYPKLGADGELPESS